MTVLLYAWYSYSEYTAPARWFIVMNYIVHSAMYTYYAFKALRYTIQYCSYMRFNAIFLLILKG